MKKQVVSSILPAALILLWGVICFAFFQCCYHYHFFYQEQGHLFLMSPDFLLSYLSRPAWLACMMGDFLTQFYYYLYLGPAILTLVLLVLGDLVRRSLEVVARKWVAYVAAFAVMTAFAFMAMRLNFQLASAIAVAGGCATFWIITLFLRFLEAQRKLLPCFLEDGKTAVKWAKTVLNVVLPMLSTVVVYWCFGVGVFAFVFLLLLNDISRHGWRRLYHSGVAIIMAFVLPALTVNCYKKNYKENALYPGLSKISAPDYLFEDYLAVSNEYYFGNYRKVMELVEKAPDMTQQMQIYYYLSAAHFGILPQKLLTFDNPELGTLVKIDEKTPLPTLHTIPEFYYAIGDVMYAERAALLSTVMSLNNMNTRMLKRMVEVNLVSGDDAAAMKYSRLLSGSLVHRKWAEEHTVGKLSRKVKNDVENRKNNVNLCDTIRLGDNAYTILVELLESNPHNQTALDYLLCTDLLTRNLTLFKDDFDKFGMQSDVARHTTLYQEALCIYLTAKEEPQEEWNKYITDLSVLKRFQEYSARRGNPSFRGTYWYYFDSAEK